jgi:hypothetical protein
LQNTPHSLIPARGARPLTHRFLSRSTQTVESGKEKKAQSGKDKKLKKNDKDEGAFDETTTTAATEASYTLALQRDHWC